MLFERRGLSLIYSILFFVFVQVLLLPRILHVLNTLLCQLCFQAILLNFASFNIWGSFLAYSVCGIKFMFMFCLLLWSSRMNFTENVASTSDFVGTTGGCDDSAREGKSEFRGFDWVDCHQRNSHRLCYVHWWIHIKVLKGGNTYT